MAGEAGSSDLRPLLGERETMNAHPKFWLALGTLHVVLGAVQLALAGLWRWWFGLAVGFGSAKMGFTLAGIGMTGEWVIVSRTQRVPF